MELTRQRLATLLGKMRGLTIAVVGDAILDRYLMGESDRLSPEAPVPVVAVSARRANPGGAANVAANLAALGAIPALVGVIGPDEDGVQLRRECRAAGFADDGLLVAGDRRTTVKTRVLAAGQQVVRIDEEDTTPLAPPDAERLVAAAGSVISRASAVVLEDYNKGVFAPATIRALIGAARVKGLPVVVDPRSDNFFAWAGATVFKPNRRELAAALGPGAELANPVTLREATARLGVENLLVTLGTEGMLLVTKDGTSDRIPARAREVFDVSGAGDTVAAWCAAALGAGATISEAARIANLAAGVEVGKAGVAVVTPAEVLG